MNATNDFNSIAYLQGHESIVPIHEGYSEDRKYLVVKCGSKVLLRTFEIGRYPEKEKEFSALSRMRGLQVRCSEPLEMGKLEEQGLGYMLLSFIEGEDAKRALPSLPASAQYRIGWEAGVELRKINSLPADPSHLPWHERKLAKHDRYLKACLAGPDRFEREEAIVEFVRERLPLVLNRPNLFQHDDFHVGNLVVREGALAGVIDFNRCDWGDPVHEFLKVGHFSSAVSVPFSIGQIRGYFAGEPDEHFWTLYSVYLAMSFFSFIVWTRHVCPDEMPKTLQTLGRMAADHEGFKRIVPRWYSEQKSEF